MRLSEEIRTILLYSRDEAMRTGCYAIAPEHLMLGLLRHSDNTAVALLRRFGLDPDEVKADFDKKVFRESAVPYSREDEVGFTRTALNISSMAIMEAMRADEDVQAVHLLSALCDCPGEWCGDYLHERGLSVQLIRTVCRKADDGSAKKSTIPSTEDLNSLLGAFYTDKEIFS